MLKISGTSHFKIQRRDFLRLGYWFVAHVFSNAGRSCVCVCVCVCPVCVGYAVLIVLIIILAIVVVLCIVFCLLCRYVSRSSVLTPVACPMHRIDSLTTTTAVLSHTHDCSMIDYIDPSHPAVKWTDPWLTYPWPTQGGPQDFG